MSKSKEGFERREGPTAHANPDLLRMYRRHFVPSPAFEQAANTAGAIGFDLEEKGRHRDAVQWHDIDVSLQRKRGDRGSASQLKDECNAFFRLGACFAELGNHTRAVDMYSKQEKLAAKSGSATLQQQAHTNLGKAHLALFGRL